MVKRKQSPPRLPLDFTKLVASRRANRVAAYKHMEGNNDHFYNIQHAVAVENDFNERQRVAEKLRLGAVPAHITHRVVDALVARAQGIAATNIEADRQAKIKAAADAAEALRREKVKARTQYETTGMTQSDRPQASSSNNVLDARALAALVFTPSTKQEKKSMSRRNPIPFEDRLWRHITPQELAARQNVYAARVAPDLIKSGNAKLRELYE